MNRLEHKKKNAAARIARVRSVITGTKARPRLSVNITNRHINAQLIDDGAQKTLVYVTTLKSKVSGITLTEKAEWIGTELGNKAKTAKIKKVVFDRSRHLYHGRVKALAEAARKTGLEF